MEDKILEILLGMQQDMQGMKQDMQGMKQDMQGMKQEITNINKRLDKIEFKMNDGFETLEMISENNSTELNKLKIKVSKLEKRVMEINVMN